MSTQLAIHMSYNGTQFLCHLFTFSVTKVPSPLNSKLNQ